MTTLSPTRCVQTACVATATKLLNQATSLSLVRVALCFFLCVSGSALRAQGVSVDPASGSATVSIPIYTLRYGNISVPVGLFHSESSLRVDESDGDAGIGWSLPCSSYAVSRQVRGLPDEVTPGGWLQGVPATRVNNFSPSSDDSESTHDEGVDYDTLAAWGNTLDTEPDLYFISAPGLSLQFVFDASGTARPLSYQDVSIVQMTNAAGFKVTDNSNGRIYWFTVQESVSRQAVVFKGATVDMFLTDYRHYTSPVQFTQSWYLSSIVDENGNTVTFNYSALAPATSPLYRTRIESSNTPDTLYYTTDTFAPQTLSSITAANYTVSFSWSSTKRLASISGSDSGLGDSFEYHFGYATAHSFANTSPPIISHSFLTSIQPFNSCIPQIPYRFSYQDLTSADTLGVPWKTLYRQDMWGGYNGVSSNLDVPKIYFYSGESDNRRLSFQTLSGQTLTSTLSGNNRNVASAKVGSGSLVQVTYPSGGYTKIIWERNKYKDSVTGQVLFGPGMRVASLISDGGGAEYARPSKSSDTYHQIRTDYTYILAGDTTTSGVALYPPEFAFATGAQLVRTTNDLSPGSYVQYTRVKEKTSGHGFRIYEYTAPAMYPQTSYSTDWTATKSKFARNPASYLTMTNVQNGYYTFPFAPNPNYDFARGQLTHRSEYSETGSFVRDVTYTYSRLTTPTSVYGVKLENLSDCDCYHFSKYQVITGAYSALTQQVAKEVSESDSTSVSQVTTVYHYNNDATHNNFMMDSVRVVYGDGSVSRTKIKYVKDYTGISSPASGDIMANGLAVLIASNRLGEVIEQYSSFQPAGGTAAITAANLRIFKNNPTVGYARLYQTYALPTGASFTPAAVVPGATQTFSYSSTYMLTSSVDDYDAVGNPVSVSDNRKNKIAYHVPQSYAPTPVATFANATAKQTVYEGFEVSTGRNLASTASPSYNTTLGGWTGKNSAILSSNTLYNSSVDNAGIPYRISCYVNAAQNSIITFKFVSGSTTEATTSLHYTTPNQWVYLEGTLNATTSMPSTLTLQVTSDYAVTIDDILLLPANATVSTQTFLPFKGVTSQTDDSGHSTVVVYDALGRKINTLDAQRNLVELDDYKMIGTATEVVSVGIGITNAIVAGQSFTATAILSGCISSATYEWQVDGTIASTSSTLATTISSPGMHNIQVKVTDNATGVFATEVGAWCVEVPSTGPSFTFSNNTASNSVCNGSGVTFTASSFTYNCGTYNTTTSIKWEYSVDNGTTYIPLTGITTSLTFTLPTFYVTTQHLTGYLMRVTVTQTCFSDDKMCPGTATKSYAQSVRIDINC